MRWCALLPRPPESPGGEGFEAITEVRFDEQNAGSGVPTQAVAFRGVITSNPNDVYTGGTDLHNPADVEALGILGTSKAARRSSHHPLSTTVQLHVEGQAAKFPHTSPIGELSLGLRNLTARQKRTVKHGNDLALITNGLARKAHLLLVADISIENPVAGSIHVC